MNPAEVPAEMRERAWSLYNSKSEQDGVTPADMGAVVVDIQAKVREIREAA